MDPLGWPMLCRARHRPNIAVGRCEELDLSSLIIAGYACGEGVTNV